ncbi:hypothetical protein SCP_0204160 [Sparassis crispa]|uniref:ASCH domain-containing protein n=1 Tax=Sparassis crispa TaxID=139825 RepID=A0A401GAN4_9APHY|nr:hypothetical protein SCP_0204160 [Sparassis crispa]GBE79219.1 hypothetical protein SCP_0204160 [Sparassis crispa]
MPPSRNRNHRIEKSDRASPQSPSSHASTSRSSRGSRQNASGRVFTDVILTIKPVYAGLIRKREKNHEFRGYRLRAGVQRLWLYESSPVCALTCLIETAAPKVPGEICDPSGIGNDEFDAGQSASYAYPILGLFTLGQPVSRVEMKARFGVYAPQGYCYAKEQLLTGLPLDVMDRSF